MPIYQRARPFDIVRTILDLQKAVKQLQLLTPSRGTPWTTLSLSNSWTGTLSVKIGTDARLQISAYHLAPGTISAGILIATLTGVMVPVGNHDLPVTTDVLAATTSGSPRCTIHTDGTMTLSGIGSTATIVNIDGSIPLDI